MSENVVDVLMFLFRNYRNTEVTDTANQRALRVELLAAGFAREAVEHALGGLVPYAQGRRH